MMGAALGIGSQKDFVQTKPDLVFGNCNLFLERRNDFCKMWEMEISFWEMELGLPQEGSWKSK